MLSDLNESDVSTCAPNPDAASSSNPSTALSEFLLVCEARSTSLTDGYWRFTLETADGTLVLDADDLETGDLNRLTLLAAVRGLESIEGPSSVTLLSNNRYLIRSLADSLPRWRKNGFVWEHFGRRVEVQHARLWQRIDRALSIHRVEACLLSTRLVSAGNDPSTPGLSADAQFRIDAPHIDGVTERAIVPAPQQAALDQPVPRNADRPSDRLRHWLLQGVAGGGAQTTGRRFTSQDLLESA